MNLVANLDKFRPYALSILRIVAALLFLQSAFRRLGRRSQA